MARRFCSGSKERAPYRCSARVRTVTLLVPGFFAFYDVFVVQDWGPGGQFLVHDLRAPAVQGAAPLRRLLPDWAHPGCCVGVSGYLGGAHPWQAAPAGRVGLLLVVDPAEC